MQMDIIYREVMQQKVISKDKDRVTNQYIAHFFHLQMSRSAA